MAKKASPERDSARTLYIESRGKLTPREIADKLGIDAARVRKWKCEGKWETALSKIKYKPGAPVGNRNAALAGAPFGNLNAETHGAYSTVRIASLPDDARAYVESIELDTASNMLQELQLLIAKEYDLRTKIKRYEDSTDDALYVDHVVDMLVPISNKRQESNQEKLEGLHIERDNLTWEMSSVENPTKQQQTRLDNLEAQIEELTDKVNDTQRKRDVDGSMKMGMQTVTKASAFERAMKLEAELNKTHGRIIKLLDSIKAYELECRRVRLDERKYNLSKQRLKGEYEVDPETGEIDDETEDSDNEID